MRFSKHLLIIGASLALSIPFALNIKPETLIQVKATEVRTFKLQHDPTRTKDDEIYAYIGQFTVGFNFMYEGNKTGIFTAITDAGKDGIYFNDNLNFFKDSGSNVIDVGEGILINGKTFKYWVSSGIGDTYVGSTGVHQFPMEHGGVYSPVSIWLKPERIEMRFSLEVFQMDSIDISFDKDYFYALSGGYEYRLAEDNTFFTSINVNASNKAYPSEKITLVDQRNEVITNFGIEKINVSSEKTTSTGGRYHYYQLYTNIVRDETRFTYAVPTDHDRYLYDNILLNGKSLAHYNAYCRANKLDFSNLSDVSTQNPDYENGHAIGSASTKYDLAARADLALENNTKYIIAVYLSNKFVEDLLGGEVNFEIREGSSWLSKDENGNPVIARNRPSLFEDKILNAINELENYVDLFQYDESDAGEITNIIYSAESDISNALYLNQIDTIVSNTKASIDEYKTAGEKHISNFLALLNAVPETMEDKDAYVEAVNAAKQAYLALSEEEKDSLDEADVNRLVEFDNQLEAISFVNYKALVKEQINSEVVVDVYRTSERNSVQSLLDAAFNDIDEANHREDVDEIYAALITAVAQFKTAKQLAIEELDAIDLTIYRDAQKEEVQDLIAKGKTIINQSVNAEEVNQSLARVLALIAKVKTDAQLINDEALKPEKETAKEALTSYAKAKGKDNYTVANWELILHYVELGHFDIDAAESTEAINDALKDAKLNIDLVEVKQPEEEPSSGSSGCGGSVIATSAVLSIISLMGIGLIVIKKRK